MKKDKVFEQDFLKKEVSIREEKYDFFSNKMRFMNLFMTLTIAAMHISYNAGGEDIVTHIMRSASGGGYGLVLFYVCLLVF